ncbi:MAG TPA: hypothetical protein VFF52_26595 [Isosphaeraceae bacterium]|nr:hypothetical protein [Isosphaeraceae bacterium]
MRRGGWNTALPRWSGRSAAVPAKKSERRPELEVEVAVHQAQQSASSSTMPAGTAGAAG